MYKFGKNMNAEITVSQLEQWLNDGQELAIFDVREHGQYGEGHLFFAIPLPYSQLELEIGRLAPNPATRIVVYDDGHSEVASQAAARLVSLGYWRTVVLQGGCQAWATAGYSLFEGVNVLSKTFGEQVEAVRHTPHISAQELAARLAEKHPVVILDGRPFSEFQKMSIPGAVCCPNGELSVRFDALVKDSTTPVVINCAGRTRSIIGAQTLIDLGVKNPVYALLNGTQGWMLADYPLEQQQTRRYPASSHPATQRQAAAKKIAEQAGAEWVSPTQVRQWIDTQNTVYLLDVRSEEEFAAGSLPGAQHAPGGQLQQATDHYIAVRHARVVVVDSENIRAPVTASWLRQMGHQAYILQGGICAWKKHQLTLAQPQHIAPALPTLSVAALREWQEQKREFYLWDLRHSQQYRQGHLPASQWLSRVHIPQLVATLASAPLVLVADSAQQAAWSALDLPEAVRAKTWLLDGGVNAWQQQGGKLAVTPTVPPDEQCIDHLYFTHDRHHGNKAAARQYLRWEQELWGRLHPDERHVFSVLNRINSD